MRPALCPFCGNPAMEGGRRCQLHYREGRACLVASCPQEVTGQVSGILSCFCEDHDRAWVKAAREEFDREIDLSENMVLWLKRLKGEHDGTRVS